MTTAVIAIWLSTQLFAAPPPTRASQPRLTAGSDYTEDINAAAGNTAQLVKKTEERIQELNTAINSKRKALTALEGQFTKETGQFNVAKAALATAERGLADAQSKVESVTNKRIGETLGFGGKPGYTADELLEVQKALALAEAAHMKASDEFATEDKEFKNADKAVKTAKANIDSNEVELKKTGKTKADRQTQMEREMAVFKSGLANLQEDIRKAKITDELKTLGKGISNGKLRLTVLEQLYNNGLIGDYLQVKMEGLLRDSQFCEAAKQAANGKCGEFKPDLKPLFTSTERQREKATHQ